MKAAIYPGGGRSIVITAMAEPRPGPDDVLIRVQRCGICGSDLSMTKGETWDFGTDVQLGHEYAGTIVETGANVTDLRAGDRVAVLPSVICGTCPACRAHGNIILCQGDYVSTMQGFAEYVAVPASAAVRLPDTLSMADGALIEPLTVSLYGVQMARLRPGDPVLVLGAGTVALYAIYWARRLGAGRIVALSRSARREDLALAMGADAFVPFGEAEVEGVHAALGEAPACVLEAVGVEGMLMKALAHVAPFGRIVSLGYHTGPDPVIPAIASYKCASIHFAVGYSRREFAGVVDLLDYDARTGARLPDVKRIISRDIPLDDLPAMIATLRGPNQETKVHVCP